MQILLPPEHFEHIVKLQPIEVENKNSLSAGVSNNNITSVVDPAKSYAKLYSINAEKYRLQLNSIPTLSEKIIETN